MNRVRSLQSMRGMLLGCSFESRPNSRVFGTAGSVVTIGLSIKECSHSKKPLCREKTRLTGPEVWAAATSKAWRDSGKASFYFSPKKIKEVPLAGCCQLVAVKKQVKSTLIPVLAAVIERTATRQSLSCWNWSHRFCRTPAGVLPSMRMKLYC